VFLSKKHQSGVTLLEVLIALLVLSIGLLGHAKLQLFGVRANTNAYLRTQATALAHDFAERLRANRDAASAGVYAGIDYAGIDCTKAPPVCYDRPGEDARNCSADEIAEADAFEWVCQVGQLLPDSGISVAQDGGFYTTTVRWGETDGDGESVTPEVSLRFRP